MQETDILVEVPEVPVPVVFRDLFGNENPVEIEIGSGTGRFIRSEALCRPDVNFLGIEMATTWARNAARRILKAGVPNVRILVVEAGGFIRERIRDESISAVHIYFPDPWPKRKHAKRRLFRPEFVDDLTRIIVPGGHIGFATDIRGYFIRVQRILSERPELRQKGYNRAAVRSGYSEKFLDAGRPIFQMVFEKV